MHNPFPEKKVFIHIDPIQELEEGTIKQTISQNIEPEVLSEFDLKRIEESISKLEKQEEFSLAESRPNFDCEIVREYRDINTDDTKLNLVSNRDLILKLGLGFEEMGQGVLEQIRTKDPLFYRYYNSLRAIEESPLN
jgi:hypothetical protein